MEPVLAAESGGPGEPELARVLRTETCPEGKIYTFYLSCTSKVLAVRREHPAC